MSTKKDSKNLKLSTEDREALEKQIMADSNDKNKTPYSQHEFKP
ncbi:hypothetical protein [Acinetobacter bereziniae]|nr:hypothetical protein [Acinetobacter bereziniae]